MSIKTLMTAEDLLALADVPGKRFELVRGELIEVPGTGLVHGWIAGTIVDLLKPFVKQRGLGFVFSDGPGFIVARSPDIVRVPDASFVSRARMPAAGMPEGFGPFAPDLAVEVASPGDRRASVLKKVREYLDGGSLLVWAVWPATRTVTWCSADGTVRELGPDEDLDGGDVLPGFRVRVADVFDVDEQLVVRVTVGSDTLNGDRCA